MEKNTLEGFTAITTIQAEKEAPLSEAEKQQLQHYHSRSRRAIKRSLVYNITQLVLFTAVLTALAVFLIKAEIWADSDMSRGSLAAAVLGISSLLLFLIYDIKSTVSCLRMLKNEKTFTAFKGHILYKQTAISCPDTSPARQYSTGHLARGLSTLPVIHPHRPVTVYVGEKSRKLMVRDVGCTDETYNSAAGGEGLLVLCYKDGYKLGFTPKIKEEQNEKSNDNIL